MRYDRKKQTGKEGVSLIFLHFLIFCLLVTAVYALLAASVTVWSLLGVFALGFLGANLIFALCFWINSLLLPKLAPGEGVEKQHRFSRWICMSVAQWLSGYAGVRVHLIGLEKLPEGPFLFVSNHRSMFDPLIVMGWMPGYNISFISKPSNLTIPIAGITARHAGFLSLDRENNREALKTILQAADYLKRGVCNIGIYPEGTRSKTGDLLPFHNSVFKIAQEANVPIVVMTVKGTDRIRSNAPWHKTDVALTILDVLSAEHVKASRSAQLGEEIRQIMEADLGNADSIAAHV